MAHTSPHFAFNAKTGAIPALDAKFSANDCINGSKYLSGILANHSYNMSP